MSTGGPKGLSKADELRLAIRKLKGSKAELDRLDDTISSMIPGIESLLADLKLGVDFWVAISESNTGAIETLDFAKRNKDWRLGVSECWGDEEEWKLLADCDRVTRARAFQALPELLKKAAEQVDEMITDRKNLLDDVDGVVEVLREEVAK